MTESAAVVAALFVLTMAAWYARRRRTTASSGPRRRRGGVGSAAIGSVYGLLSEDKRRAVEIIVENKTGERRPEYPDGDLPQLEDPRQQKKTR